MRDCKSSSFGNYVTIGMESFRRQMMLGKNFTGWGISGGIGTDAEAHQKVCHSPQEVGPKFVLLA